MNDDIEALFRIAAARGRMTAHRPCSDFFFVVFFVATALFASSARADFAAGEAAFARKDYAAAHGEWLAAANTGDARSQERLGALYEKGLGTKRDDAQALSWFRKAAKQGDAAAQYALGVIYRDGRGVAQDEFYAAGWLRKAAAQGGADAQLEISKMFEHGIGVPLDLTLAAEWIRKAAVQDNADAQARLAFFYEEGFGVPKDEAQALVWYRKSAEQGRAESQVEAGYAYLLGRGTAKDDAAAFGWFMKAAKAGNARAQHRVGDAYEWAEGTEKDLAQAVAWYREAAAQHDMNALTRIGALHSLGKGLPNSGAEALARIRETAEAKDVPSSARHNQQLAQRQLAWMYRHGVGLSADETAAYRWLRESIDGLEPDKDPDFVDEDAVAWIQAGAEHANIEAQKLLGAMYDNGNGVARDAKQALVWYLDAAEQGDARAQWEVGGTYYGGNPQIPRNFKLAQYWFKKLAAREDDDGEGRMFLLQMYRNGEGTAKDDPFVRAIAQRDEALPSRRARNYHLGKGVERDDRKALELYLQLADQRFIGCPVGTLYFEGVGVPHDRVLAYRWLTRGVKDQIGENTCTKTYASLRKTMTKADFERAETNPADSADLSREPHGTH